MPEELRDMLMKLFGAKEVSLPLVARSNSFDTLLDDMVENTKKALYNITTIIPSLFIVGKDENGFNVYHFHLRQRVGSKMDFETDIDILKQILLDRPGYVTDLIFVGDSNFSEYLDEYEDSRVKSSVTTILQDSFNYFMGEKAFSKQNKESIVFLIENKDTGKKLLSYEYVKNIVVGENEDMKDNIVFGPLKETECAQEHLLLLNK